MARGRPNPPRDGEAVRLLVSSPRPPTGGQGGGRARGRFQCRSPGPVMAKGRGGTRDLLLTLQTRLGRPSTRFRRQNAAASGAREPRGKSSTPAAEPRRPPLGRPRCWTPRRTDRSGGGHGGPHRPPCFGEIPESKSPGAVVGLVGTGRRPHPPTTPPHPPPGAGTRRCPTATPSGSCTRRWLGGLGPAGWRGRGGGPTWRSVRRRPSEHTSGSEPRPGLYGRTRWRDRRGRPSAGTESLCLISLSFYAGITPGGLVCSPPCLGFPFVNISFHTGLPPFPLSASPFSSPWPRLAWMSIFPKGGDVARRGPKCYQGLRKAVTTSWSIQLSPDHIIFQLLAFVFSTFVRFTVDGIWLS